MYDGLSKAVINLSNLEKNYKTVRAKKVLAVVKANAYGHGTAKVAEKLLSLGCSSFCVESFTARRSRNSDFGLRSARFCPRMPFVRPYADYF